MADQKTTKTKATKVKKEASKRTEAKKSLIAPNDSVKISFEWKKVEPIYKKTITKLGKNVKAEGFRVGKAPATIVEQKIGLEKIIDEVLRELLPEAYTKALKKSDKKPITTPEFNPISLEKGKEWTLEAYFSNIPEVKLGDYKKVVQKAKKTAEKFVKERNAQVKKEAEACKNDSKDHDHKHAHKELGDNEKREIELQHIFKDLVDAFAPTIGELLLRQETQNEYERLATQLKQYGISTEDYLKRRQITIDQLSQELAGNVLNRLQLDFIMAEISKAEKLDVDDKEAKEELAKLEDEKMRKEFESNEKYFNQLKANLLQKKTLDLLLSL